ncbi:MAG: hypothetical protein JXR51_16160 [Bacteroidales bacterium]|nr:hypothetical protein [Bacteroidales bacterium]MBN2758702.1 hypothetical protein [Bacteroidales bacterium]
MEFSSFLPVIIGIFIIALIIRFVTKMLFKFVGLILVIVLLGGYMYFNTDYFENHQDSVIVKAISEKIKIKSLNEYQKQYCENQKSKLDSIKCECFIKPIFEDLSSKYSSKELEELYKDKNAYVKAIIGAVKRNQDKIKKLLEENNALHLWNGTIKNLQKGEFL